MNTSGEITPRYLRVPQAAVYIGYADSTVYRLVEEKRIPHIKKGRAIFFDRLKLDKWMQESAVDPLPAWDA